MRKSKIAGLVIGIAIALLSCQNESTNSDYNCYDCSPEGEMFSAYLRITVSINNDNPQVPIVIYKGEYNMDTSKNIVVFDTIVTDKEFKVYLPVDNYYTVKALYNWDGKQFNAIDGNSMKKHNYEKTCDFACWAVTGDYINVTFKFD